MAVALLGYFTTMVTAFVGLMFLLSSVLSSSYFQPTRPRPYPTPVFAEAAIPAKQPAVSTARVEAPKAAPKVAAVARDKTVRVKVARDQRRKEDFAGRQQDRPYSLALGYAENSERQPGALFDLFGTRRF